MQFDSVFLGSILNSLKTHIAVTDQTGLIVYTNRAWQRFGQDNGARNQPELNYISVCKRAAESGDKFGKAALAAIEQVRSHTSPVAYIEYPCDSPTEPRWFTLRVTRFQHADTTFLVMAHQNITRRKLAEIKALELSNRDSLTGLYNRRYFDRHLDESWSRHLKAGKPLAVALLDIDYFKRLNDTYGHAKGDECLSEVGKLLADFTDSSGSLAARYGGEEFALIFQNTDLQDAEIAVEEFIDLLTAARIEHRHSPNGEFLTVSAGIASLVPKHNDRATDLFILADTNLYKAKRRGRNCIAV